MVVNLFGSVVKNLFKHKSTRKFPKEHARVPATYRGRHIHYNDRCIYCGMCAKTCPSSAIKVDAKRKTWEVDLGKCLFCQQCEETCRLVPKKDAIKLTRTFDMASNKKDFVWKG